MKDDSQQQHLPAQESASNSIPCHIDARGSAAVQIGDQGTQINYFYNGTWTDGVAAAPLVNLSGTITSPYRGLSAFGERDAELFFGRETAASEVLEMMSQHLDGTGLLVVSGVSGAGKSSLMRAGVLRRFRSLGLSSLPEARSWPCVVFSPGSAPLDELATRIAPLAGTDAPMVRRGLAADPTDFALTARAAALTRASHLASDAAASNGASQRRVLLVVDQCEELFTQCATEEERRAFITALHAAATPDRGGQEAPATLVVLVIRADFEARLANYPLVTPAVQTRYLLTAMTRRELQLAITQPANIVGSSVDTDLVQVLLEDVVAHAGSQTDNATDVVGAGVLPLLSHTLDQAWRTRTGRALTLADYVRTRGIAGAVALSAERAFAHLTPTQQDVARQIFVRLTATSSDGTDTAVRASRSVFLAGGNDASAEDVEAVLETFADERLLTLAADTVEISHEVLLTAWPRFRDSWLAETHADRIVLTGLKNTVTDWVRSQRDPSFLYVGSRLQAAADVTVRTSIDRQHAPVSQDEEAFLDASHRATRRRTRRLHAAIVILLALLTGLAAVVVAATRADQESVSANKALEWQRDVAISSRLASQALANTNGTASRLQSIAAYALTHSAGAYYAMLVAAANPQIATLTTNNNSFASLTFNTDGKTLATIDMDNTAELWNIATGQPVGTSFRVGNLSFGAVAFSSDDRILAIASLRGTVQLWNVATHKPIGGPFAGGQGGAIAVSFSPGNKILATVSGDNAVQLWSVATQKAIERPYVGRKSVIVGEVAFSPNGKRLLTSAGSGPVQMWNVATHKPIGRPFAGEHGGTTSVAFNPTGTMIATVGADYGGPVRLWSAATHKPIGRPFAGEHGGTTSVAFNPTGTMIATVGRDGEDRLWWTATRTPLGNPIPSGSGRGGGSVAFSPDGTTLAVGNPDGAVGLWNVAQVTDLPMSKPFASVNGGASSVEFSPDGKKLATVGATSGLAQLWNVATGTPIGDPFGGGHLPIDLVTFSPNGKMMATSGDDNQVRLWDVATHQQIGRRFAGGSGGVASVAFDPNGTALATVGNNGQVRLWDVATHRQIGSRFACGSSELASVAFDPNGTTLATVVNDGGPIRLWNVATHQQIGSRFAGGSGGVASVAFDPNGTTLATVGNNGQVRLWDVATHQQIGSPIVSGTRQIYSVAFSPDGRSLATGDEVGTLRLWDVATGHEIGDSIASGFTSDEDGINSVAFSPNGKMLASVGNGTAVRIWNVDFLRDVVSRLCSQVGGSVTRAEWAQYVGPGPAYQNICPSA
jgi:WD40 repeat protein